ncbi:ferric iron reductase protein FhuF [Kushneria sinocarnis]|uniref:Ferric iron reductase protein FhuF n=1 Tax=Kushneria sinocarnis TaxID=595502 RepID=A0A420WU24_9GAMM|nr:siderophore-iron reductase FhuF [Kushneria sinocarnis]RKQ96943.1 ferric iron reductase protein FhuF [Kushneria sinocarnis]
MFAAYYPERFSGYREALVLRSELRASSAPDRVIAGSDLLEPDVLQPLLDRFAGDQGLSDPRAIATQWSKHYLSRLLISVVIIELRLDRHLPTALDELDIAFDERGIATAFGLTHAGTQSLDNGCARFCSLISAHMTPLIASLARQVRLSPRVLWSNAAGYFEFVVGALAECDDISEWQLSGAREVLKRRWLPDRQRNPFYQPVEYVDTVDNAGQPDIWRCRRMCCMRYLDESLGECGNCPRLKPRRGTEERQAATT